MRKITLPMTRETIDALRAGETVLLSGTVYTARDAAHLRMEAAIAKGIPLPFGLKNQTVFYLGPGETKPGCAIGAAGPTSSYRMDSSTPLLLDHGMQAMIGKGPRGPQVVDSVIKHGAVYFAAVGGTAALLSKCITTCEIIAYEDLGTEAIRRLTLEDFPVIVALDRYGRDQYRLGPETYKQLEQE